MLKKKILFVGGNSFIGSLLLKKLFQKKKYEIYSTFFRNSENNSNISYIYLDVNKFKKKDLIYYPKKIDNLIILSWCALNDYNSNEHKIFSKNLLKFTKLLLNHSNISLINVLGSCLEYGVVNGEVKESYDCLPVTNYGRYKLYYLNELKKLKLTHKFKFNWMRIFYMYGDVRNRGIWSQFLKAKKNNQSFKMSYGQQKLDFLHIDKLINYLGIVIFSNRSLGIINICSGRPKKLLNLVKSWSLKHNVKLHIGYYPYTKYESMSYWGSNDKINRILNSHGEPNKKF